MVFFSFFTTSFVSSAAQRDQKLRTISIDTTKDDYALVIAKEFLGPVAIGKISFSSDVFFERDEFFYLTGLRQASEITADVLTEAVGYLIKKNKFSTITLRMLPCGNGSDLHIDLIGFWTFARVKIHGLLVGKDAYKHSYSMEPGDPFDAALHKTFLDKIRQDLLGEGFFSSKVSSELKRDQATKTIQVHVFIDRGPAFSIQLLPVTLRSADDLPEHELEGMRAYIHRHCFSRLSGSVYNKKNTNKAAIALRKYLTQQGFFDTKIELQERINTRENRVHLSFVVAMHSKKKCIFLGNHFFSTATLLDHVMTLGPSSWLLPAVMLQQDVVKMYVDKGFRTVTVAIREEPTELFFVVNEGVRCRINKITIIGAAFFEADVLIKNHFKDVLKYGYCDEVLVQKALESLCDQYKQHGFLDVDLASVLWNPCDKASLYDLQIVLREGERSHIASVRIPGYEQLEGKGPCCATMGDGTPIPFATAYLSDQRVWLQKQLGFQNSVSPNIRHELKRSGNKIAIVWLIDTSPLSAMKFGKTIVTGSSGFPFALLKREFCYQEGDPWDQKALKKTLKRIKALDVFERVHVYPYAAALAEEKKTVMVKVHKDDRFEIRLRPGVALQQLSKKICFNGLTYKLGGSFIVKNPLNAGDQFRIETDFTRSQQTFEMSYRRPWLFSWPIKTIFKVYDNKYDQPGCIGIKKNVYRVTQQGFLTSLTKQHETYDAGINLGFEYMETVVQNTWNEQGMFARSIARAINFEPQLLGKKIPYAVIEPTLIINRVDNAAFPRNGIFGVYSCKSMFPIGKESMELYFVRLLAEQTLYVPIKALVLALRCRFGHIFHKDFASIMPTERFYLGGANSIRSYETDLCPPLGVVDDHGEKKLVPQGGKSMVNINIEGRFPLYGRLGGVLFQDFGALSRTTFPALKEEKLLAATGFGLRYHTPLGPLRFDFGLKWHAKVPHESRYAWFLTFGHAF